MTQQLDPRPSVLDRTDDPPAGRRRLSLPRPSAGSARTLLQRQGLLLILIAICVYLSTQNDNFLTLDNMLIIFGASAALGLMAVPQTFLIITGGFDLSVGSMVALSSVTIGLVAAQGYSPWTGAAVACVAALVLGVVNAVIVLVLGINPLITTLGTLSIVQGLAYMLAGAQTLLIPSGSFDVVGIGIVAGLPVPFIAFVVVLVIALVVERMTPTGRSIYAIGGNREAARLSGLRIKAIPFVLYLATAVSGAVGGAILASQLGAASADVGTTYQLSVVTAVILGGTSLAGGRGSVVGTTLAVLILGVLQNGFALLGLSAYAQTIALGFALVLAVLLDQTARRWEARA